jgi:hypothetical protein
VETARSSSCDSIHRLKLDVLAGKKANYSHVQSKVKQYILGDRPNYLKRPIRNNAHGHDSSYDLYGKSFLLSPGRKSLSMSNIAHDFSATSRRSSSIKSYLSAKNLDDLQVTLQSRRQSTISKSRDSLITNDRISRLLDDVSDEYYDEDDQDVQVLDDQDQAQAMFDVEDILQLAMDERKGKQEAKQVLAQLQTNYDNLQKKYAAAETTIDKLR